MTLTRRSLLSAAGLAAATAVAGCSNHDAAVRTTSATGTAGGTAGGSRATVGLTYIPNVQFAPFYVGVKEGYFSKRGVDVSLRHHGTSEGLFTALASGEEHLVIASGDEVVEGRAHGLDLVAVSSYYRTYPVRLLVPAVSPILNAAQLKGARLGVPGRYGASWLSTLVMLEDSGLRPADLTIAEIGYTSQAALATHKVDAVMGFSNNDAVQLRLGGIPLREVPLTRSGTVPLVSISLVTTRSYLEQHRDTVKAVADGMLDGIATSCTDKARALEDTKAFVPTLTDDKALAAARATLDATAKIWVGPDGAVSGRLVPAQWDAMAAFMRSHGLIDREVKASDAVASGLVSR